MQPVTVPVMGKTIRTDVVEYELHLDGVFGRNRTRKFKAELICRVDASSPITNEEAIARGMDKLREEKLKSGRWHIIAMPVELTNDVPTGRVIRTYELMNRVEIATGRVP